MRQPKKGRRVVTRRGQKAGTATFTLSAALSRSHRDRDKARALEAYLAHGTVSGACAAAGIARATWYRWIQDDEEFALLALDATEAVTDALEEEAIRRALTGSDTLLIFLLKANRRAKYGDHQTLTKVSPEVVERVDGTVKLIASQPSWQADALLDALTAVWN